MAQHGQQCRRRSPGVLAGMALLVALGGPGCRSLGDTPAAASTTPRTAPSTTPLPDGSIPSARFGTEIVLPAWTGQTRTGEIDAQGRIVSLECTACHSELEERRVAPRAAELQQVHVGLQMQHGTLSCFACHDPGSDYATLRLADGTPVDYPQVMTLCSQCHGPQRQDYDHGAHGGMNGYWDLSRGPRQRNACTVCHDPHAPAYPKMRPTFKPRDRFLSPHPSVHPSPDPESAHVR